MNTAAESQRIPWSLFVAAAIAFIAGLTPIVFGGPSSRFAGAIVPFAIGAIGFAAVGILHNQSRAIVAIVYFLAGLAIVYALMSMFSLPLRLAALGSCPIAPDPCTSGLPRSLSDGENNGLGAAAAFGIVSLFVAFFGLVTIYRRHAPMAYTAPPLRKIPPMAPAPSTVDSPDNRASETPETVVSPDHRARDEEPELPAPEELPELPAHESSASTS